MATSDEHKGRVQKAMDAVDAADKFDDASLEQIIGDVTNDFKVGYASDPGPEVTNLPTKRVGLKNADAGVNPKDRVGASKVDLTLIPPTAQIHCALALMDGATKYGPYNWRVEPIQARTYVAAIMRHCQAFLDGELSAPDSGILHMGHIMASAAILLDAEMQGTLIDDRPMIVKPNATASVQLASAHDWISKHKPAGWGR